MSELVKWFFTTVAPSPLEKSFWPPLGKIHYCPSPGKNPSDAHACMVRFYWARALLESSLYSTVVPLPNLSCLCFCLSIVCTAICENTTWSYDSRVCIGQHRSTCRVGCGSIFWTSFRKGGVIWQMPFSAAVCQTYVMAWLGRNVLTLKLCS